MEEQIRRKALEKLEAEAKEAKDAEVFAARLPHVASAGWKALRSAHGANKLDGEGSPYNGASVEDQLAESTVAASLAAAAERAESSMRTRIQRVRELVKERGG